MKLDKNRAVKNQTTSTPSGTSAAKSITSVSFNPGLRLSYGLRSCLALWSSSRS
ncbi:MAG TPA: hypothetical protein VE956_07235 [Nodularia sp. (in: cyanobacteria)]|nr:hypothetical protein [Nodularia sp. (in: cyanobacteria)]